MLSSFGSAWFTSFYIPADMAHGKRNNIDQAFGRIDLNHAAGVRSRLRGFCQIYRRSMVLAAAAALVLFRFIHAVDDARPTFDFAPDEVAKFVRAAAQRIQSLHVQLLYHIRILQRFIRCF